MQAANPDPRALVAKVVEEAGGRDALRAKRDVEYTYLYRNADTGAIDLSIERYRFEGEKSWARYDMHENAFPDAPGVIVQGHDGKTTWQTDAGKRVRDPAALKRADFLRKTNFYWFAMTFKLLDPGMNYAYRGKRSAGGTVYDLVEVTFDAGVGDVSDTYLLYINPKTKRVDQFLFTVLDFGRTEPLLMTVEYERVEGVLLPMRRRYAPATWSGRLRETGKQVKWTDEISTGVRFDNGFSDAMFQAP